MGHFFGWGIVGFLLALLIGVGMNFVGYNPAVFTAAKICFAFTEVILISKLVASSVRATFHHRLVMSIVGGVSTIAFLAGVDWVDKREAATVVIQSIPAQKAVVESTFYRSG